MPIFKLIDNKLSIIDKYLYVHQRTQKLTVGNECIVESARYFINIRVDVATS